MYFVTSDLFIVLNIMSMYLMIVLLLLNYLSTILLFQFICVLQCYKFSLICLVAKVLVKSRIVCLNLYLIFLLIHFVPAFLSKFSSM